MSARPAPRLDIVPMSVELLHEVLAIERTVFSDPWSAASFRHEVEENRTALTRVARLWPEGPVLGYFVAWFIEDEVHLGNLAVHPERQGEGTGQHLLDHLVDEGRRQGGRIITLEVRESNMGAQRLYLRNGFRPIAIRRRYYPDNHEDAIVMMLELKS
ncbi:MAG: ribosomal protein S18-alanine N-acetyltransferase [Candidatus Eisenbacteria bacterium]|nr:ribosomal protein S18-alanine N-acetyltransferase [Candidatus Eisenbacteria bacterium]